MMWPSTGKRRCVFCSDCVTACPEGAVRYSNDFRMAGTSREGLVIHTLGYQDGDRLRPVAHRLSFAEMVVPYRDPTDDHKARTAFDIGEWGLGFMTTSLELGCDCLGEIRYLDAVLHNSRGEPLVYFSGEYHGLGPIVGRAPEDL